MASEPWYGLTVTYRYNANDKFSETFTCTTYTIEDGVLYMPGQESTIIIPIDLIEKIEVSLVKEDKQR